MSGIFEKPEKYFKAGRVRLAAKQFSSSLFCILLSKFLLRKINHDFGQ